MYTPGQVAKLLFCNPSTVRRYAGLFANFLSPGAQPNRRRIYTETDLSTFILVRELLSDGILIADIPDHLDKVIDQDQPASTALTLPGLIVQLQDMQAAFDLQSSQLDQLQNRITWLETPFYKRIGKKPPE